ESMEARDRSQDVVPQQQVGLAPPSGHLACGFDNEELDERGYPLLDGDAGHVRRRLDPERGNPPGHEMLEEITVVAGDLDHLVPRTDTEALDHILGVDTGVLDPAVRVRREVGVIAEDL